MTLALVGLAFDRQDKFIQGTLIQIAKATCRGEYAKRASVPLIAEESR